jgi:leucyl/phenylalanyl-tRNA--protein transferase
MSAPKPKYFPPAQKAGPEGLLCVGGKLTPAWLMDAYRNGIFPWPVFEDEELLAWWSPDPRAVLELDGLRISRRLRRTCRSGRYQVSINRDFAGVMHGCATAQDRREHTWITPRMLDAYNRLHERGVAHSIEVWEEDIRADRGKSLVGGVYGVAIGGLFAGESMFYRARDASKVAVVHLVAHLRARGYVLLDLQQINPHTASLGAIEIERRDYLRRLQTAVHMSVSFGEELEGDIGLLW